MADTFALADSILKDWYWGDKVIPQMITYTPLLSKVQTSKDNIITDVGGRKVVFPVNVAYGQGLGARSAGEALPAARNQQFAKSEFGMKKLITHLEVQGEAWRATEGAGKKSFISMLRQAINDGLGSHAKELNGMLYRDGTGNRATVTVGAGPIAPAASANITVGNAQYLTQGMLVDFYNGAVLVTNGGSVVVNTVDRETGVVNITNTNAGNLTVAVGNTVYRAGNKDRELMGLSGIVNNASGLATLQGITVASNPWWAATVLDNAGTPRALTLDLMERAYNAVMSQNNQAPDVLFMDFNQKRRYEQLLVSDKRYVQTQGLPVLDGGYGKLAYNNVPIEFDTDCQAGRIYFLNTRELKMFQQWGYQWISSPDKKNIWDRVAGYDSYEAVGIFEAEFATTRRNQHAVVTDLVTP